MLRNSDLTLNFFSFRLCSLLFIYPFYFRSFEEGAKTDDSWWRKLGFKFWQGLTSCHLSYMILRTGYIALFTNPNWDLLCLIIILILCFGTFVFFMIVVFEKNLQINLKVFNEILTIRDELYSSGISGRRTPIELVLCHLVTLLALGLFIYPILYALDMDAMYLIISWVPVNWRNPGAILFCLILEMVPHVIYLFWLHYALYVLIAFSITFYQYTEWNTSKIRVLERPISRSESEPEPEVEPAEETITGLGPFVIESMIVQSCSVFRRLSLYVNFFNLGMKRALFQAKQLCLAIAIGGGFLAIKLFRTKPEVALMYLLLHTYGVTFHTAMFSLAHGVTTTAEELKRVMLLSLRLLPQERDRKSKDLEIKSVSPFVVNVGGFYCTERESVLIFMNFVVQQLVGLLVSF